MTRCLPTALVVVALTCVSASDLAIAAAPGQAAAAAAVVDPASQTGDVATPVFSRHVVALFSRLGCNGGACHGAVQGKNGFRLSLFGAKPAQDYEQIVRAAAGRRVNLLDPDRSLFLLKATGQITHEGGKLIDTAGYEYQIFRRWIAQGAASDDPARSRVTALRVTPAEQTVQPGHTYNLRVQATFADGSSQDVTRLCRFESLDKDVAAVSVDGQVRAAGVGDAAVIVRFRAEPVMAMLAVPRPAGEPFPDVKPNNFIDQRVLAKLRRLNIPPAAVADDATFLRRATLDVTGMLPDPDEVRAFLADTDPNKRARKIDQLLARPGYAALWTLKFCDLLKAAEFGVYADGLKKEDDAPRFQAWVRARIEQNLPYDQFVQRIITATSREGRSLDEWADEVVAMYEGADADRKDIAIYRQRKTLDLYWQRAHASGVEGALQVAHAFLGLRLQCAQCHRHPHDVWQQDDLLSFANFFMNIRKPGFQGDNEKKYPEAAAIFKKRTEEGKQLEEQAKKLKETKFKEYDARVKDAKSAADHAKQDIRKLEKEIEQLTADAKAKRDEAAGLTAEKKDEADKLTAQAKALDDAIAQRRQKIDADQKTDEQYKALQAEYETFRTGVANMERRGKTLQEAARRIMHAQVMHLARDDNFASVTSPLGTQQSKEFRLLGESEPIEIAKDEDPRGRLMAWLRRPDNPFFAKAIVNRVWAHYFGRGIVDPPDNLSPFNPATHPELLDELCRGFIKAGYDLKWLHRTILASRTYQQSSTATAANAMDRSNYACFYYRRLPAEVLLDAINQATGTSENMDMKYWRWPEHMRTVEIPFEPQNKFIKFMLEQFGRPERSSNVQCDCERDGSASVLQVMSLANHPHVFEKIADKNGRVARIVKQVTGEAARVDEIFLAALSRLPDDAERQACLTYLKNAESADKGLAGVMWSLLNTREFLLQH